MSNTFISYVLRNIFPSFYSNHSNKHLTLSCNGFNLYQWGTMNSSEVKSPHTHSAASELMCLLCKDLITSNKSLMEPGEGDSISLWQAWLYLLSIQTKQFCLTNAKTHPENSVFAWDPFHWASGKRGKNLQPNQHKAWVLQTTKSLMLYKVCPLCFI